MTGVALLVMTDGRDDLLWETVESAEAELRGPIIERWVHDDTGSRDHRALVAERLPDYRVVGGPRAGFGGAIRRAWATLLAESSAEWVLHLESDFTFNRSVDLACMIDVLAARPHIAQMALRRQPWNDRERAAGGVVESNADAYTDHEDSVGHRWLEHRLFLSTNPSLYRLSLCERGWPEGPQSEGRFSLDLFASDPAVTSAYWGARDSGEAVFHTGNERVGVGY